MNKGKSKKGIYYVISTSFQDLKWLPQYMQWNMKQIDKEIREKEDPVQCSKLALAGQHIKDWPCPRGERSDNGLKAVQRMRGQVQVTDTLKEFRTGEPSSKEI